MLIPFIAGLRSFTGGQAVYCDQALLVEGEWRCDDFMKLDSSSSGCESRPARGEPARAGSEPGDGLGNGIGDA